MERQLKYEMLNAFNRHVFGVPSLTLADNLFGVNDDNADDGAELADYREDSLLDECGIQKNWFSFNESEGLA